VAGPAVGLASRIRRGQLAPDIYMGADAEVNDEVLMGRSYFALPDGVDVSDPSMMGWYRTASYRSPQGQTFRGSPMVYRVAIPAEPVRADPGAVRVVTVQHAETTNQRPATGR
jgi:hypothetical protein